MHRAQRPLMHQMFTLLRFSNITDTDSRFQVAESLQTNVLPSSPVIH